jgi:hexosaminidase
MKKFFKIMLYLFCTILGLVVALIIFLQVYYTILEKRQAKVDSEIKSRSAKIPDVASTFTSGIRGDVLNLIPVPKKVKITNGVCELPSTLTFSVSDSIRERVNGFLKMLPGQDYKFAKSGGDIQFIFQKELSTQAYTLYIRPGKIDVHYSHLQGLYYAVITLKVLNHNYSGVLPCVSIEDSPDLEVRGLMLDISRNKIPTKETLLNILQLLADLKYNHFELYVEGFSFAYPSFKNLWEGKETPVTIDEIKELDSFCRDHFIDLTGNQNSLGHMASWLETDQYKDLAECPDGFKMMGLLNMKATINPTDPHSFELVSKMTDDILPAFTSENFNVNLDEPFELGKGKSRELSKKIGVGRVYLDYAIKLHDLLAGKNKKMLMWGDIVLRHPELISSVPKDVTLLDWGYEASYPYERHCKILQQSGLNYMVCPGTNSWTSITGRTDNMLATVRVATTNGVKYGAKGMLITDWGDMGHWQYLPVSYAGYVTGGALSWNSETAGELPLAQFLSSYVFNDKNSVMGELALNLGRYNRFEEFPMFNMTTTMISLEFGLRDKIMITAIVDKVLGGISGLLGELAPEMTSLLKETYDNRHLADYTGLEKFLDTKLTELQSSDMQTSDSLLIKDEYANAIRLIKLGSGLQKYINTRSQSTITEEISQLEALKKLGNRYLDENKRLWLLRNKPGGYELSTASLNSLMLQINNRLDVLGKSSLSRAINRFLERTGTAGAVMYIKSAS